MSFLQPILLIGLPLALLPIVIHLINQHRHRTVKWAAMMFLLDAKKMTKGLARLRQILILAMRVLAVAFLLFAASRPLAGGWMSLTGGKPDLILILLDRSASMEQQNLETGASKRLEALSNLADLLEKTAGGSEFVLIDSATLAPTVLPDLESLTDLPQTSPTATAADIPALLQAGIDFMTADQSGQADIWLVSDMRETDWQPGAGQWQSLRNELASRENTRLFLLSYPRAESDNLSIAVHNVKRRRGADGLQLVLDLTLKRHRPVDIADETTIPVEFTVNGTRTVQEMVVTGQELVRLGHVIPLGAGEARGWGRFDLPADDNPIDNTSYFVFDEPALKRTVIVSDDRSVTETIRAAAASPVDSSFTYAAETFGTADSAQVPWAQTALLFWHAPLPAPDSTDAALLRQHVEAGRALVLLPPEEGGDSAKFLGISWGEWLSSETQELELGWWRTESELLQNTRNGAPLPLGDLNLFRARLFSGDSQPLLKLESGESVIARAIPDETIPGSGPVYIWGTLPGAEYSTLASDGVAFFIMVHRALEEGAKAVSRAQALDNAPGVLPAGSSPLDTLAPEDALSEPGLLPGAFEVSPTEGEGVLLALNRPVSEDSLETISAESLETLFAGVDYQVIADEVDSGSSLASEIWRLFLIAMAVALVAEAALCLPPSLSSKDRALGAAG